MARSRIGSALLARIRSHLRGGGVIAYATEAVFGLGCDPRNRRAVQRVLALKRRPRAKGVILIAGGLRQLRPYIAPPAAPSRARLAGSWPGPTTFLMRAARRCPPWLTGRHDKVAVRVTAHPAAAALCNALGMALVSTSANVTGRRPLATAAACARAFGSRVLVIPGRVGRRRRPSAIIDFETGRVLRA